jgi:hypothetical protein
MVNQNEDMNAFPMKPPMMRKGFLLPGKCQELPCLTVDPVMEICKGVVFTIFLNFSGMSLCQLSHGITYHPPHPRERMGYVVIAPSLWKTYPVKV